MSENFETVRDIYTSGVKRTHEIVRSYLCYQSWLGTGMWNQSQSIKVHPALLVTGKLW